MQSYTVVNLDELAAIVRCGNSEPEDPGPVVVEATLWDGQIVRATYYRGEQSPDITAVKDDVLSLVDVVPVLTALLANGTPFITQVGEDDLVCTLRWTISDK